MYRAPRRIKLQFKMASVGRSLRNLALKMLENLVFDPRAISRVVFVCSGIQTVKRTHEGTYHGGEYINRRVMVLTLGRIDRSIRRCKCRDPLYRT